MTKRQSVSNTFAVVIPAAGQGSRIGGTRKQFRKLGKYNPLIHCIKMFSTRSRIKEIIVVGPEKDVDEMRAFISTLVPNVTVVAGGASRQESVYNGLKAVGKASYVLIHDAVRPFISADLIERVMKAAVSDGAAAPAIEMYDSVRRGDDDTFGRPIPRDGLYRVQTPQGFEKELILSAHKKAVESGWEGTDDVSIVSRFGKPVQIVQGSAWNRKITTPEDWAIARVLWPGWQEAKTD